MAQDPQLTAALNLMRRMPPAHTENSLAGLIELVPNLTDELLNHVDQPLKVKKDSKTGKQFVLCDYNRDGDSYRSPWSSEYFPAIADGFQPSERLRKLEVEANGLFDVYRKLYFEGGYSSVYFFDTDDKSATGFGACFLIHKDVPGSKTLKAGWWDSIHVFEVQEVKGKKDTFNYRLTTTVMVSMNIKDAEKIGDVDLSGHMTKQVEKEKKISKETPHIMNMGPILEEMELAVRNAIEGIYIQKTREVIGGMRSAQGDKEKQWNSIAETLKKSVADHAKKHAGGQ